PWARAARSAPPSSPRSSAPCWRCSASTRAPSRGPRRATARACATWSTPWSRSPWRSASRPAPARTRRPPPASGTGSPRRGSPSRTPRTGPAGSCAAADRPGPSAAGGRARGGTGAPGPPRRLSSQSGIRIVPRNNAESPQRGAPGTNGGGTAGMPAKKNKKGPTKGSGGKTRRSLEGKKGTLPASERHWYAGRQRRAADRAEAQPRPDRPSSGRTGESPRGRGDLLVGRNPVLEALRAGMPATRLFLANSLEKDVRVNEAAKLAGDAGVEISEVPRAELDRRCDSNGLPGAAHQGIALQVRPYRYWSAEDLLDAAKR